MGIAATEAERTAEFGRLPAEIRGSVRQEEADAASACHSFWEVVGRGAAGAKGARLSTGLAQQEGVWHFE
jgi:hypothetical protein